MVSAAYFRLGRAAVFARTHGVNFGREVLANFVLPYLFFNFVSGALGVVPALLAASTAPILWSIIAFIRERKIDAISLLALSGIALSLVAFAGGGGIKMLELRENLVTGLVGLVFLGSSVIGRPLIYQLARAGVRRRAADKLEVVEALGGDVQFRRSMMVATLVWGFGLLAACALNCVLVFAVSIEQFLLIHGPINYAAIGFMTAWTFWYVPHSIRRAATRRAARAQGEPGA